MIGELKAGLRRELLAKRDALSQDERRGRSLSIAAGLFGLPEYKTAGSVLFYVNFRSEVATRKMIEDALAQGKKVLVPKVDHRSHELKLFEIKDISADLEAGYMNIYEPVEKRDARCLAGRAGHGGDAGRGVRRKGQPAWVRGWILRQTSFEASARGETGGAGFRGAGGGRGPEPSARQESGSNNYRGAGHRGLKANGP